MVLSTAGNDIKPSRFNIRLPHKSGDVIFNTATGKWSIYPELYATMIQYGILSTLPEDRMKDAVEKGIFVPECADELRNYRSAYYHVLHDKTSASFVCALTFSCNLACPYCFESRQSSERLEREMCNRIITAIRKKCERDGTRVLSLMLFGGEPLLNIDIGVNLLSSLGDWCKSTGRTFIGSISSNGVLWQETHVRRLSPYLRVVNVTFDGPPDTHDRIRISDDGKPTYDVIVRTIRMFRKKGINVHIRVQICRENADRIEEAVSDLNDRGLLSDPGIRVSFALVQALSKSACEYTGLIDSASALGLRLSEFSSRIIHRGLPAVQLVPCPVMGNTFCIDPNGYLYKCVSSLQDPIRCVGRVDDRAEFVLNDHYYDFVSRDPTQFATCASCVYLPMCGGGCPRRAFQETSSYHEPYCGDVKGIINAQIQSCLERLS